MALRSAGALACSLALLAPTVVSAQGAETLDRISRQLTEIEEQVDQLQRSMANEQLDSPRRVEERLTDADLMFNMQDYNRAALMYLDVVENHPDHPGYPEALYQLAESLYQTRNYYGARTRFREVLQQSSRSGFRPFIQGALGRLIEIAIHLEEYDGVEEQFSRLSQMPPSEVTGATHYARGRFLYHRDELDEAARAFSRVPEETDEYLRSQYHLGVIMVQREEYPQAIDVFTRIGRLEPDSADDRNVVDLAHIAVGALRLEMDEPGEAIRAYQDVSRNSRVFDQALYQAAAAFSRLGDSTRAERALEVLTVAAPDSNYIPRAKILRGNLLLDTGRYREAREVFHDVVDRYQPVRDQLDQVLEENRDPEIYFQELVRANLEVFDVSSFLPPLAIRWVQQEEGFQRAMSTLERTAASARMLRDTERVLIRLEAAVNGPSAVNIFPGLRSTAARAIQLGNELARVRGRIAAYEGEVVSGGVSAEVREVRQERRRLEQELNRLPTDSESYEAREEEARMGFRRQGRSLARINGRIDRLQAMVVAIELYLRDTAGEDGLDRDGLGAFEQELEVHRDAIETYRRELVELRTLIETGQIQVGIGDDQSLAADRLRERYNDLVAREREMLAAAGGSTAELRRAEQLFQRTTALERSIGEINSQVVSTAQEESSEVREVLTEERANLGRYAEELSALEAEAEEVIGQAAYQNFQRVQERFYELVRQGDVGIVDVAWAEREEHRQRIERLGEESRRQLQLLDDEFSEVMGDVDDSETGQ